jgi:ankyrin repeat protein
MRDEKPQEKTAKELRKLGKRLLKACSRKNPNIAEIRDLLAQGAHADYESGWNGETPIVRAVSRGSLEAVEALAGAGANLARWVNYGDGLGATLLSHAIGKGNLDVVKALVRHGARAGIDDLGAAIKTGNVDVAALLLGTGMDLNYVCKNTTKNFALDCAEKSKNPAMIPLVKKALVQRERQARLPAADDPRDARIAELEAQIRALSAGLTAVQGELEALKSPAPADLGKRKLNPPGP